MNAPEPFPPLRKPQDRPRDDRWQQLSHLLDPGLQKIMHGKRFILRVQLVLRNTSKALRRYFGFGDAYDVFEGHANGKVACNVAHQFPLTADGLVHIVNGTQAAEIELRVPHALISDQPAYAFDRNRLRDQWQRIRDLVLDKSRRLRCELLGCRSAGPSVPRLRGLESGMEAA